MGFERQGTKLSTRHHHAKEREGTPMSRVLVVEPNSVRADGMSTMLRTDGHDPVVAKSRRAALDALTESSFDVVL